MSIFYGITAVTNIEQLKLYTSKTTYKYEPLPTKNLNKNVRL